MTEEDKGRQVPYHRSGGGISIVGGGRSSLALAAMLAMTTSLPTVQAGARREVDWWGDRKEPDNRGRRAEKDAIALAKAKAKRQRKAAKRAANVGAGNTATEGHNDRVEGRDAASSRRVPSHDGLCGNGSKVGAGDTAKG